jgi:MFS family permease
LGYKLPKISFLCEQIIKLMSRQEEEPRNLRYAWYVVSLLMIAYIFSFIDRQILSLLVTPIKRDMHLNDTQMSMLMGLSFALFYALFGLPFGRWADTGNRKWIITFGIVLWSLTTAFCGLITTFSEFFVMRMLVGVGEATLSPAAYSLITDYFPKEKLARAMSIYGMGVYLGSGLALVIGGAFVYLVGTNPTITLPYLGTIFNWQLIFFYVGLPGILVAMMISTIREPQRSVFTKDGKSRLPLKAVIDYITRNGRAFFLICLGFGFYTMSSYSAAAWIPTFFERTYGWSRGVAGITYGIIVTIMCTLGIIAGGTIADNWQKKGIANAKVRVALLAVTGFLPFTVIGLLMPTAWWAIVFLVPATFFSSMPMGAGPASIQLIMPGQMRAFASSIFIFIVNLMGIGLGPTSVALITDYLFQDELMLRYSLIINTLIALSFAFICFRLALNPYIKSLIQVEKI